MKSINAEMFKAMAGFIIASLVVWILLFGMGVHEGASIWLKIGIAVLITGLGLLGLRRHYRKLDETHGGLN